MQVKVEFDLCSYSSLLPKEKSVSFVQTVGITSPIMSLPSPHFLPVVREIWSSVGIFF